MPAGLAAKLRTNTKARATWEALAPSRQKEIKRYLNNLKRPQTLAANIERVTSFLQTSRRTTRTIGGIRIGKAIPR